MKVLLCLDVLHFKPKNMKDAVGLEFLQQLCMAECTELYTVFIVFEMEL